MTAPTESGPRFALTFVATVVVTIVGAVAINILGNAGDLFPSMFRPALSDRAWKARRLATIVRTEAPPKVLILGSSRVMQMRPDYVGAITGKKVFNNAVTGGNLLDCLVQFRYALRIGAKPDLVIMNVDEGMLQGDVTQANLRLCGHAGLFQEIPPEEKPAMIRSLFQGLNLELTRKSLGALLRPASDADGPFFRYSNFVILPDGYRFNPRRAIARENGDYDLQTEILRDLEDARVRQSGNAAKPCLSPKLLGCLRQLLAQAKAEGIAVRVITTPQHPSVADSVQGRLRNRLLEELRQRIRDECGRFGFTYHDFSDLASFGGDPNEFWDAMHQTPVNLQRMTNVLFGIEPTKTVVPLVADTVILTRSGYRQ